MSMAMWLVAAPSNGWATMCALASPACKEKTADADQKMAGADIHMRHSEGTYIEAEVARSKGPGFGSSYSADGGLTIQNNGTVGTNKSANAYRAEARAGH